MNQSRLEELLDNWVQWMKRDSGKLGFPKKSLMFATDRTVTTDAFDEMCETMDNTNSEIVNSVINDLSSDHREAIFWRFFKQKPKPMYYELKLSTAFSIIDKKLEEKNVI